MLADFSRQLFQFVDSATGMESALHSTIDGCRITQQSVQSSRRSAIARDASSAGECQQCIQLKGMYVDNEQARNAGQRRNG